MTVNRSPGAVVGRPVKRRKFTILKTYLPLTLVVGLAALLMVSGDEPSLPDLPDEQDELQKLRVRFIRPVEVHPGDAVVAEADGLDPAGGPLSARVSIHDQKFPVRVLRVDGERVAIQLPRDLPEGTLKVRLYQDDRHSKPRLLQVRPRSNRNLARNVLGGLSLLAVGLFLVGRAFRHFASRRLRAHFRALTRSRPRGAALGTLLGAVTQSTTGAVGLMVGMLRTDLLRSRDALGVMVGVQLGAATAGAVLPFFASREALWWVVLGVVLTWLAQHRSSRAFGHVVLGCGILFLGLTIMQEGLKPLLSEPALLPLMTDLSQAEGIRALLAIGMGALLSALLQGPGPAFVLVAALTQSTSILSVQDALLVLSGTALGSAAGTALVALPSGRKARRLWVGHVLSGAVFMLVTALLSAQWSELARLLLQSDAGAIQYGSRVLRPNVAAHLSTAFVLSQVAAVALTLPVLSVLERVARRVTPRPVVLPGEAGLRVSPSLTACRTGIIALRDVITTGDRAPAALAEQALSASRATVTEQLAALSADDVDATDMSSPLTACLHLTIAADAALRVAERALERELRVSDAHHHQLLEMIALLVDGVDDLIAHAEGQDALLRDDMQAREIRLNALEARARASADYARGLEEALWMSELCTACEAVGNHLYRLGTALLDQPVQTTSADTALAME